MPEPSLSEINSFEADPERGTGTPAVVIDNTKSLELQNRNAMFHAENDWKKYNVFLDNVNNIMKDVNEVSAMDVATQDRPYLEKEKNAILSEIYKNPADFFGPAAGLQRAEIQKRLSKFHSDSQESKLNRLFDDSHRQFMTKNPSYQTDDNKSRIEGFWNKPLGERQLYTLDVPAMMDLMKLKKGIMDSPTVKRTNFEYGYSPDKKFISQDERTKYLRDPFLQTWNAAYSNDHDANGKAARQYAKQQFDQLPKHLQEQFGDPQTFWNALGEQYFGSDKDIEMTNKGKLTNNPYTIEQQKASDKLQQMKAKHGFDIDLELTKQKGRKALEGYKHELKGMEHAQKMKWLNNYVDGVTNKAVADGKLIIDTKTKDFVGYEMPLSESSLEDFKIVEGKGAKAKEMRPTRAVLSPDGKSVSIRFYKQGAPDPKNPGGLSKSAQDEHGNRVVEDEFTKEMTIDEFKARVGKTMLGMKDLVPELEGTKGAEKEKTESTQSEKKSTTAPVNNLEELRKKYSY